MIYEFEKLFEEIELDEAKKEAKLITDRRTGFKRVNATILSNEYFAHKNDYTQWCVTDAASGLLVQSHFRTLADASDFVKHMDDELKVKIAQKRETPEYKEMCAKLAAANPEDYDFYESLRTETVWEALEELEDRQIELL